MLRGILLLTFVSCCWASCCMPKQWEAIQNEIGQSVTSGKAATFLVTNVISYDETNSRLALIVNSTNGSVQTVTRVIQNYNKGIQYNIDLLTNKCTKSKIVGSITPPCVPANAVKGGSVYVGGGKIRLPGDTYFWKEKTSNVNIDIALTTVSTDGTYCYPVGEVATGTANTAQVLETVGFVNILRLPATRFQSLRGHSSRATGSLVCNGRSCTNCRQMSIIMFRNKWQLRRIYTVSHKKTRMYRDIVYIHFT